MARLTAFPVDVGTLLPFQIRHLLRQATDGSPGTVQCGCIERMAGCAKFRLPDMGGFRRQETLGTGMHYPLAASIDCIGTINGPTLSASSGPDQVAAIETPGLTEIVRLDLVADSACHAVHSQMRR